MSPLLTVTIASALAWQLAGPALSDEVRVASSGTHTLVIAPDGTVLCQGRNQYSVCGTDLSTKFVEKLDPVLGVPKGRAVAVADAWTSMVSYLYIQILRVSGRKLASGQVAVGQLRE